MLILGQFAEGERPLARGVDDFAVADRKRRPVDREPVGRQVEQEFARTGGDAAQLRHHAGRRPAAERSHVERREIRVGQHEANRRHRHTQLLGHRLRQRRPGVLADFDLAAEGGHLSRRVDVQPRAEFLRHAAASSATGSPTAAATAPPASRFFLVRVGPAHGKADDDARAQDLEKVPTGQLKLVPRSLEELVAFRLDQHLRVVVERRIVAHGTTSFVTVLRSRVPSLASVSGLLL